MNRKERGQLIKQARRAATFTQAQLAEKLGVTRITVSNWENGIHAIDAGNAINLALTLKIPLEKLVSKKILETKVREINKIPFSEGGIGPTTRFSGQPTPPSKFAVTEDGLNVSVLWDHLPHDNPVKKMTREAIENEHRRLYPEYWNWSSSIREADDARDTKPGKKSA